MEPFIKDNNLHNVNHAPSAHVTTRHIAVTRVLLALYLLWVNIATEYSQTNQPRESASSRFSDTKRRILAQSPLCGERQVGGSGSHVFPLKKKKWFFHFVGVNERMKLKVYTSVYHIFFQSSFLQFVLGLGVWRRGRLRAV